MAGYRPRSIFSRHCHTRKQSPADQLLNKKQCSVRAKMWQLKLNIISLTPCELVSSTCTCPSWTLVTLVQWKRPHWLPQKCLRFIGKQIMRPYSGLECYKLLIKHTRASFNNAKLRQQSKEREKGNKITESNTNWLLVIQTTAMVNGWRLWLSSFDNSSAVYLLCLLCYVASPVGKH